jgi:hypothetical protein
MNEIVEYVTGINVIIDNAIARKAEIKSSDYYFLWKLNNT